MKKPTWDVFADASIKKILSEKKSVIDIGGGLRIDAEKNNVYDKRAEKFRSLVEKTDYKIMDYVDTYNPDFVGDIQDLPFDDNSQDAYICRAVLEHVPNPIKGCEEMHRTLKKDGYVFVYVPYLYSYHALEGYYGDYWRFSKDTLEWLFRDYSHVEIVAVRGALETWINLSPVKKIPFLLTIARFVDTKVRKRDSKQVSGYNVFAIK